jgi:magnesium-transporting ATPase (P-type)
MIGMPDTEATFWQTPLAELTRQLGTDINGLTSVEAAARLQRYGANRLESQRRFSLLRKILSRFRNPLVLILLAAATVSAFTGDIANLVIISTMVLFSVLLDSMAHHLKKTLFLLGFWPRGPCSVAGCGHSDPSRLGRARSR